MPANVPAVAELAETLLLKYCCSRNWATYALFLALLVAGWVEGRLRRPEPETDLLSDGASREGLLST